MEVGVFTMKGCSVLNICIYYVLIEFKMSEKVKKQRKVIRKKNNKGYNDNAEEKEGVVYGARLF